ncbi:MAG: hypothetical protein IID44_11775 [Planctomycetes bacterium]|nr:hypothetical protein [Planctomycetota bacterium]
MADLTWRKAIEKVLSESGSAMHYKDIAERVVADGLRKHVGATPGATVSAQLTFSINKKGERSPFVRVRPGQYLLNPAAQMTSLKKGKTTSSSVASVDDAEEQYDIVTSFGMYWQRAFVDWKPKSNILGMQQIGAEPVNFQDQLGIYLLYDGREVIYVGRTTDRPLGRRLNEHTADRLSTRWDRFSWFGLLPVSDKGVLGKQPGDYSGPKVIPALEAILIEALEPRQNRKRGDDLAAVEYLQKQDPAIDKKRKKELFDDYLRSIE